MGGLFSSNQHKSIKPKENDPETGYNQTTYNNKQNKSPGYLTSFFSRKKKTSIDGNSISTPKKSNKKSKASEATQINETSSYKESNNSYKFSYTSNSEFYHSNNEAKTNIEAKFPLSEENRYSIYDNVPIYQNEFPTVPSKSGPAKDLTKAKQNQLPIEAQKIRKESKNKNHTTAQGTLHYEDKKSTDCNQSENEENSDEFQGKTSGMTKTLPVGTQFANNEKIEKTSQFQETVSEVQRNNVSLPKQKLPKPQLSYENNNYKTFINSNQTNTIKNEHPKINEVKDTSYSELTLKTPENTISPNNYKNEALFTTQITTEKKSTTIENHDVAVIDNDTSKPIVNGNNFYELSEDEARFNQNLYLTNQPSNKSQNPQSVNNLALEEQKSITDEANFQVPSIKGRNSIHVQKQSQPPNLLSPNQNNKTEETIKTHDNNNQLGEQKIQQILQQNQPFDTLNKISPEKQKSLDQISEIKLDAEKLSDEVDEFSSTEKDKQFIYLDEMLTRNLLKLDNVEIYGDKDLRQTRREAIKFSHQTLMKLRKKAEEYTEKRKSLDLDFEEAKNQNVEDNVQDESQNHDEDVKQNYQKINSTPTEKRKLEPEKVEAESLLNSKKSKQNGRQSKDEAIQMNTN